MIPRKGTPLGTLASPDCSNLQAKKILIAPLRVTDATAAEPATDLVAKAEAAIVQWQLQRALAVTRGLPEFRADPDLPTRNPGLRKVSSVRSWRDQGRYALKAAGGSEVG
jgi:hypothetical protein